MTRKNESITLSCSTSDREALAKLAITHKCTWGDKPNISELICKIARGELMIVASNEDYELAKLLDRPDVQRAIELLAKKG